jgi:hypothetical protein
MMFNLFKKKQTPADIKNVVRNTLLGDVPIPEWGKETTDGIPWSLFAEARGHIVKKQNYPEAIKLYQKITETPGLESRHYLQAWHFLRRLKVNAPAEVDPKVYGVLVDVHIENGTEFVAAYADHSARYFNYTGGGIIWEAPDSSLNDKIDTLLQACEVVTKQLQPLTLEQGRPIPPKNVDTVQINILTPGGIRHGIGTFEQLSQVASANAIIAGATDLMKNLVDKNLKK